MEAADTRHRVMIEALWLRSGILAGDALKIALATILLPAGWRLIGRSGQ